MISRRKRRRKLRKSIRTLANMARRSLCSQHLSKNDVDSVLWFVKPQTLLSTFPVTKSVKNDITSRLFDTTSNFSRNLRLWKGCNRQHTSRLGFIVSSPLRLFGHHFTLAKRSNTPSKFSTSRTRKSLDASTRS